MGAQTFNFAHKMSPKMGDFLTFILYFWNEILWPQKIFWTY